jgi:hypothetical protein
VSIVDSDVDIRLTVRLLDIFRVNTLTEYAALDLDEPEQRRIASSSKSPLRLSPFWHWQDLHLLSQGQVSPCSLPSKSRLMTGKCHYCRRPAVVMRNA